MARVTVTNSTLSGNTAYYSGGGVGNYGGTVTLTNSTPVGQSGRYGYGGGVANLYGGTVTVTNSTLSGNRADNGYGGGVANSMAAPPP